MKVGESFLIFSKESERRKDFESPGWLWQENYFASLGCLYADRNPSRFLLPRLLPLPVVCVEKLVLLLALKTPYDRLSLDTHQHHVTRKVSTDSRM